MTAELERILASAQKAGCPGDVLARFKATFLRSEEARVRHFNDLPPSRGSYDFDIELKEGEVGIKERERKHDKAFQDVIDLYLQKESERGRWMQVSYEEADSISNWVRVVKKDGKIRPCVGVVQLNKRTRPLRNNFPSVKEILQSLDPSHKIFFTADCFNGFNLMRLTERASRHLCVWDGHGRVWKPLVAPFGPTNCPQKFHELMDWILGDLDRALEQYVDDTHGGATDWARSMDLSFSWIASCRACFVRVDCD